MADTFRQTMLDILVKIYPQVCAAQTPEGKSLNTVGTFTIYGQCTGLYYAALYAAPGNPYYRSQDALDRAIRSWEFYYSLTLEDGQVQHITYDQDWGVTYEEWCTLHWIETIRLLRDVLPPELLARWEARAYRGCQGICANVRRHFESETFRRQMDAGQVANHYLWNVVCACRYGQLTGQPEILALCDSVLTDVCRHQLPFGTWYEGGSLVVSYAYTSLGALTTYCGLTGNENETVVRAVKNAVGYLTNASYDDMTGMDAIDGRNHYKKASGMPYIPGSLLDDPAVSDFAARHLRLVEQNALQTIARGHQGLGFFLASFLITPADAQFPAAPAAAPDGDFRVESERLLVLRRGGFRVPLCAKLMDPQFYANRWILDRANLLSVWHTDTGLLLGGGHSKADPCFASFSVTAGGVCRYMPEASRLLEQGAELTYGGVRCTIEAEFPDARTLTLRFRVYDLPDCAAAHVHLPLHTAEREHIVIDGRTYDAAGDLYRPCETVELGGAAIACSPGAYITGQHYRFNPYKQKQAREPDLRAMILHFALDYKQTEATVTVRVPEVS